MGFAALVAACGAATDPDLIDIPNVYEGGGVGSADGSSDADSTTSGFDAPSDATGLASHSDSGDAESGATGAGQDAEVCTPVSVMDVPSSGGAACPTTGTACYPNDETSFSPTWVPPLPRGNRCTATQIGDFYDLCLGPSASDSPCGTWTSDSANATCLGCLKTPNTASAYGVFIQYSGSVVELNEAGCVALAEPCNLKCAQTWLASIECREAACTSTDCPEQSDQIVCAMSAASCSACEGYAEAAACMTELTGPDHPAGTLCAIGSDDIVTEDSVTMEDYTSVASFMCGM
jgi:hypothetical protein